MKQKLVEYIQYSLENKPLAYQLGFLQAHLAEIMHKDTKHISDFKAKIQRVDQSQKPKGK